MDDPLGRPKNAQLARNHHTVPQFHLERFAHDGQVMRVALPGSVRHRLSVRRATVERDFYMVQGPDNSPSDEVERSFSQLEGLAAEAVRQVVDGRVWPIPSETRLHIAGWAALQYLRTQAQRQVIHEIADLLVKVSIAVDGKEGVRRSIEKAERRPATDAEVSETWTALSAFDDYMVDPGASPHLHTIGKLLLRTTAGFMDRGWQVIRFERKALITTDNPVVLIPDPRRDSNRGTGLETAAGVLVPLDRRVALLMAARGAPNNEVPGTAAFARDLNQKLASSARQAVFHHPDDQPLVGVELPEPRDHLLVPDDPSRFLPREP